MSQTDGAAYEKDDHTSACTQREDKEWQYQKKGRSWMVGLQPLTFKEFSQVARSGHVETDKRVCVVVVKQESLKLRLL